jgi:hypothetical protein
MAASPMQRLRTNVTLAYREILRADLAFEPVNAQEPLTKSRRAVTLQLREQRNVRSQSILATNGRLLIRFRTSAMRTRR